MAEELLCKKFPTFRVHFDECFGVFSSTSAQDPYDTESSISINRRNTCNNKFIVISRRFPVVSKEAIQDVYSVAVNKHM